jgi:hypothetical protein
LRDFKCNECRTHNVSNSAPNPGDPLNLLSGL